MKPGDDLVIISARISKNDESLNIIFKKTTSKDKYPQTECFTSITNILGKTTIRMEENNYMNYCDAILDRKFAKYKEKIIDYKLSETPKEYEWEIGRLIEFYLENKIALDGIVINIITDLYQRQYIGEKIPQDTNKKYFGCVIFAGEDESKYVYVGELKNFKFDGNGLIYEPNKNRIVFEGKHEKGYKIGFCQYYENGIYYTGNFHYDRKEGLFKIYYEREKNLQICQMKKNQKNLPLLLK